ncbi:rod-binding protein [Maricaulis sp. CAU 1757]
MDNFLDLQMQNATTAARANGGPNMAAGRSAEDARAAAEEFESFFLSQMIEQMFSGVGEDNPFGGGAGEKAFTGLLHEEYAKVMSQAGGLGLADRLTSEILRYQEEGEM